MENTTYTETNANPLDAKILKLLKKSSDQSDVFTRGIQELGLRRKSKAGDRGRADAEKKYIDEFDAQELISIIKEYLEPTAPKRGRPAKKIENLPQSENLQTLDQVPAQF